MAKKRGLLFRFVKFLFWLGLILTLLALLGVWQIGGWNMLFENREYDVTPPQYPSYLDSPAVLVFSKTNSFRHKDGIAGGKVVLEEIVKKQGRGYYATENGAIFNDLDLSRFGVVVFLNATGDMLSTEQELAFQQWLEAGGGWLGIHAAGDGSHREWQWYRDNLIGADFTAHILGPQHQRATVVLENQVHPALIDLPDIWQHDEEWYSWERSPRAEGFSVLATLDEDSYSPWQKTWFSERDLRMGDHPVVWSNCVGQGRSVYAAMGHTAAAFEQPQVRRLLKNSITWLMAGDGANCKDAILPQDDAILSGVAH